MITNTGKAILSKYLIGQSPSYASHIAIGCGPTPLSDIDTFDDYSSKENLDFEMFRVPILSRGYVTDDFGNSSISLTAELPTEERYEITEVGIFSAGNNPSAGSKDSKTLFSFARNEGWEYHNQDQAIAIPVYLDALNANASGSDPSKVNIDFKINNEQPPAFHSNSSNLVFTLNSRIIRHERCRFLDNMILIAGDDADISSDFVEASGSNHIHLTGIELPLDLNSPTDQLRMAFSVINRVESAGNPDAVRIVMEFRSTESSVAETQYARFEVEEINFTDRYFTIEKQIQDLPKSINFTWSAMTVVKISVSVIKDGSPSNSWYVAMDAVRLENTSIKNPLYGLTGYSVIKTPDALPVIKGSNTKSLVEFRFAIALEPPIGSS